MNGNIEHLYDIWAPKQMQKNSECFEMFATLKITTTLLH